MPSLQGKQLLRFACDIFEKGYHEIGGFLARVFSKINPQILDYQDVNRFMDVLFQVIEKEKVRELVTFESALGIIQLSSLGEYAVSNIIDVKHIMALQNLMFEENDYIIHAALEILNNLLIYEKTIQLMSQGSYSNLFKIIVAHLQNYHDKLKDQQATEQGAKMQSSSYDNPEKILCTIYSVLAVSAALHEQYRDQLMKAVAYGQIESTLDLLQSPQNRLDIAFKYLWIIGNSPSEPIQNLLKSNFASIQQLV